MINNQVPLEVISKLMGHSNMLVTQQIYARLDPKVAARYLAYWTLFLEDEEPKSDEVVDQVLRDHSDIKIGEYNSRLS